MGFARINRVHAKGAKKTQRAQKQGLSELCVVIFAAFARPNGVIRAGVKHKIPKTATTVDEFFYIY